MSDGPHVGKIRSQDLLVPNDAGIPRLLSYMSQVVAGLKNGLKYSGDLSLLELFLCQTCAEHRNITFFKAVGKVGLCLEIKL